jgi:hypothetical protein
MYAMADLSNPVKRKLEHLFEMRGGYVMDFSNAMFVDFVETSIGLRIYDHYQDSKAQILRALWRDLDDQAACRLIRELLDYWEDMQPVNSIDPSDAHKVEHVHEELAELEEGSGESVDPEDLAFLEKDLGSVDLAKLAVPLKFKDVIAERLTEIESCLKAKAPLAVIFLCGSTLEGLLAEIAGAQPQAFITSSSAPKKRDGSSKALNDWTLFELIEVARDLNLIGEDVVKHAHAVRDFRNYIHPRQQVRENFSPRMVTAEIADKVVRAAIVDLGRIA